MKREKRTKELYKKYVEDEWNRLIQDPFHKLELDTTLRYLEKYLPKNGLILDAGGGPGRYTIELVKRGYRVVLLDFTPENLSFAKREIEKQQLNDQVDSIVEGSIVDLSKFKDETFDAVLCLGGPLSHVYKQKEREKAMNELTRVLKKESPLFVSVMGKYGTAMCAPGGFPEEIEMTKHWKKFCIEGDDDNWKGGEGHAHFFIVDELSKLYQDNNLEVLDMVGLEGLASPVQEDFNKIAENKIAYKNWLDMHYKMCTQKSIADLSLHFMLIGKK